MASFDKWLAGQSLPPDAPGVDFARRAWEAAEDQCLHSQFGQDDQLTLADLTPVQRAAHIAGVDFEMIFGSEDEVLTERELIKSHLSDAYAAGCAVKKEDSIAETVLQARADLLCERLTDRKDTFAQKPSAPAFVTHALALAMEAGQRGGHFPTGQIATGLIEQLNAPAPRPPFARGP